jgi:rSAM/selenodomain-associated transferase 2
MAEQPIPSIGIVVPLLNESRALPSLLAELAGVGADKVLFVDGGSDDGTRELLQRSGVNWMASEPGRAVQMNAGADHVHCDVLLFLHADTLMTAAHVDDVRRCMADPACVGGRFDVRLTGRHPLLPLVARMMNLRSRLTRISTGDQAMFVRRKQFDALGGFPPQPLMEDIELSRRLKRRGRICCLGRIVTTSGRRWQQHGLWSTIALMWMLRLRYWLGADVARLAARYRQVR